MMPRVDDVRWALCASRAEQDGEPIDASFARYIAALVLAKWPNGSMAKWLNGSKRVQSRLSERLA